MMGGGEGEGEKGKVEEGGKAKATLTTDGRLRPEKYMK